jgi:hypothetical protein
MCADGVGTHLTLKFLKHLDAMHVRLVLRTPNCSHKQQVEDLYNFWVLKNGASKQDVLVDGEAMRTEDAGWYKVKQLAVQARMHATGRADLPFAQMMKLLKPVWERAFLPKGNLIGWRMAGLNDKGGVTARPAWLALKEAEKADAAGKKPAKKRKAEALSTEQLGRNRDARPSGVLSRQRMQQAAQLIRLRRFEARASHLATSRSLASLPTRAPA